MGQHSPSGVYWRLGGHHREPVQAAVAHGSRTTAEDWEEESGSITHPEN